MTLEKTRLRLGFVPLCDAAPLLVAKDRGFFAEQGLEVELTREASWASIRDKVAVGALDGAQMLAPMPLAATLPLGPPGPVPAYLLVGCGLLALYALVEFPFSNPAVLESFWFCFFSAVRYHKLTVADA